MKNRKRESCTSGTVRDEDGNILIYSARDEGLTTRWGGRRPKSAKARNRGRCGMQCRGRYGDFAAGLGLPRLERCGRGARLSWKTPGLRRCQGVDHTSADAIEGGFASQSRELMRA
jgi:hypothetical protein